MYVFLLFLNDFFTNLVMYSMHVIYLLSLTYFASFRSELFLRVGVQWVAIDPTHPTKRVDSLGTRPSRSELAHGIK